MPIKLTRHLTLLATALTLSSCMSWAMRWKIPPPTVGDRIGAAALDVVTLPIQAVAIPASLALDRRSQTLKQKQQAATTNPDSTLKP